MSFERKTQIIKENEQDIRLGSLKRQANTKLKSVQIKNRLVPVQSEEATEDYPERRKPSEVIDNQRQTENKILHCR